MDRCKETFSRLACATGSTKPLDGTDLSSGLRTSSRQARWRRVIKKSTQQPNRSEQARRSMCGYSYCEATEAVQIRYEIVRRRSSLRTLPSISGNRPWRWFVHAAQNAGLTLFQGKFPLLLLGHLARTFQSGLRSDDVRPEDESQPSLRRIGAPTPAPWLITTTSGLGLALNQKRWACLVAVGDPAGHLRIQAVAVRQHAFPPKDPSTPTCWQALLRP